MSRYACVVWTWVVIALAGPGNLTSSAADYRVSGAEEIARLAATLRAGDVLVMADGTWKDQVIAFQARGMPGKPITLRAETPGKVILTGGSSLRIDGEHLVVNGLWLKDGTATGDSVRLSGRNCRLTETAIVDCKSKFYAHLFGTENRLDHCYLAGKTSDSPTLRGP